MPEKDRVIQFVATTEASIYVLLFVQNLYLFVVVLDIVQTFVLLLYILSGKGSERGF